MEQSLLLLLNPRSGKGLVRNALLDIADTFVKAGYDVTVRPTQEKRDAYETARRRGGEFATVVCCGGDGTLNETVSGLMELEPERRPLLGYIPAGTINDFASTLRLSKNMVQAARDIVAGRRFPCDVGRFNDSTFVYVASFGIFTDVAYSTPQQYKNMFGRVAYFLEGIKELSAVQSYRLVVKHDGETLEDEFIFGAVSNSTSVAGFPSYHTGSVKLDDGLFEVLLIRRPQNLKDLHTIVTALLFQTPADSHICSFTTASLSITPEQEVPWTLDGEFGGCPTAVRICSLQHAIHLLVPPGGEERS